MGSTWKGSTKIILKDVNTGKETVTEDENIFKADNIAASLRSMGYYNCDPFYNPNGSASEFNYYMARNSIWKSLVGGIMLFDSTIPETAINMPAGVKMIGNGSYGRYNNGTPNELGSWNDVESSVSDGKITLVYDYTTQQANGRIKSVSLTSREGGYAGMGNQSGKAHSSSANLSILKAQTNRQGRLGKNGDCYYTYIPSEYWRHLVLYNIITSGKMTVTKTPFYTENIDLCADPYNDGLRTSFDIDIHTDTPYSSGGGNNYSTCWCCEYDDGKIALLYTKATELNYNDSFYIMEIDLDNRTCSDIKEFHSPIDDNIKLLYNSSGYQPAQVFEYLGNNRFIIVHRTSTNYSPGFNVYYFDANTDELNLIPDIKAANGSGQLLRATELSNNLFLLYVAPYSGSSSNYIYDAINNTASLYNGNISVSGLEYHKKLNFFTAHLMQSDSNGWQSAGSYTPHHNPFYLATINNLSEPVYKTDSQTMKVIYTLTRQQS